MNRTLSFALVIAITLLPVAAPAALAARDDAGFPAKGRLSSATHGEITVGGLRRTFLYQEPAGTGPFPLVILLHGGTQNAREVWTQTSLPTLAARDGFVLVAPDAHGPHWNDGRGSTIAGDAPSSADDVGFLRALIDDMVRHHHADARAVFMTGVSNGGFMTMHFACVAAGTLRAAGNVISTLPRAEADACRPGHALPWISVNGTADPLVPFGGQDEGTTRRGEPQPALLSADDTFRFWADAAQCAPAVHSERLPSIGGPAGTWAERRTRSRCAGETTSVQYVLHGTGHAAPGMRNGLVVRVLGKSSDDVDAGTILWEHFRSTLGSR